MKVLIVEPGQYPREAEIEKGLAAEQAVVGGLIECVYPWQDNACIVCKPWHPSPAVREEIRQLDKRIEQYEFLMNRDIRTLPQLRNLYAQTEVEVRQLNAERNRLYKIDPKSDQIPLLTQRLRELRKTIKLCKRIEEHSLEMAQRQEEEKRRAEQERSNAHERESMELPGPIRP